jgi:WD40 repeat protein
MQPPRPAGARPPRNALQRDEMLATLQGHAGRVNCVKWVPAAAGGARRGGSLLLSGGADGSVRVWAWRGEGAAPPWACLHTLEVGLGP